MFAWYQQILSYSNEVLKYILMITTILFPFNPPPPTQGLQEGGGVCVLI
jgi:hypothetical protein